MYRISSHFLLFRFNSTWSYIHNAAIIFNFITNQRHMKTVTEFTHIISVFTALYFIYFCDYIPIYQSFSHHNVWVNTDLQEKNQTATHQYKLIRQLFGYWHAAVLFQDDFHLCTKMIPTDKCEFLIIKLQIVHMATDRWQESSYKDKKSQWNCMLSWTYC
jgi:hypothetical protein